jgi:hypothetical protein
LFIGIIKDLYSNEISGGLNCSRRGGSGSSCSSFLVESAILMFYMQAGGVSSKIYIPINDMYERRRSFIKDLHSDKRYV